jgi:hypothetical protein
MMLVYYPEKKVVAGDFWKSITGLGISYPLEAENTWRLHSVEKDAIRVSAEGIITTRNKELFTKNPNGVESKIDLSGVQKLTGEVNPVTGWPRGIKINSEVKGFMTLHTDSIPTDLEIPMEILTESSCRFVKK